MTRHIKAPPADVYRALLDRRSVAKWMVPDGMTSEVHSFDAREGGTFRISLTYDSKDRTGKTDAQTDTFHGRFVKLVPDELVVEAIEFESADPAIQGEMTVTIRLALGPDNTTELSAAHDNLPRGVAPADNELGWSISLGKLAKLVEGLGLTG